MTEAKLGDWRWYVGCDESDDEMLDSGTRDQAILDGQREYRVGETFYVVEARMRVSDEQAMERGTIDTAPFADTRNGEFITNGPVCDVDDMDLHNAMRSAQERREDRSGELH